MIAGQPVGPTEGGLVSLTQSETGQPIVGFSLVSGGLWMQV